MARTVRRLLSRLNDGTAVFIGVILLAMVFIIAVNTLLRYSFDTSWNFVEEYTAYGLIVLTFLPLAWTLQQRGHLSIDLIVSRLSGRKASQLNVVTASVSIMTVGVMLWHGWRLALQNYQRGVNAPTYTMTPLWIPQAFIVIGLALFLLQIVAYIAELVGGNATNTRVARESEDRTNG